MTRSITHTLLLLFALFFGCEQQQKTTSIVAVEFPDASNSSLPNLFTDAEGTVYMTWVKEIGKETELLYSQWEGQQWRTPEVIATGNNWFVNWADFPSFISGKDYKVAHWLQKSAPGTYDYDVKVITKKADYPWSDPFKLHKDTIKAEHGFVSMLPLGVDRFFATWLDGRHTKSNNHDHAEHEGAMTLRAGFFNLTGEAQDLWELDHRTCDCCQTASVLGKDGPIVVYRDRTESEVRDIYLTKYSKGIWSEPKPVAMDLWQIPGCPVNGPDIAANGEHLAVIWYTGANNTPKVQLSFSQDQGDTFSESILLAQGNTLGRVGIAAYGSDKFAATWMETQNDMALVKLGIFNSRGLRVTTEEIARTSLSRASGFPVITSSGEDIFVAWTDVSDKKEVKLTKINY